MKTSEDRGKIFCRIQQTVFWMSRVMNNNCSAADTRVFFRHLYYGNKTYPGIYPIHSVIRQYVICAPD